jgi:hypothetical protein
MIYERFENVPDGTFLRHRDLLLELADWEFA